MHAQNKYYILGIFYQKFHDEIFGHGAGHAEVVLIKLIIGSNDVPQSLFICFTLKWRQTTQSKERDTGLERLKFISRIIHSNLLVSFYLSASFLVT